jgi:hypothetical protein
MNKNSCQHKVGSFYPPFFLRGLNTFRLTYVPHTVYNGIIVK